MRGSTHYLTKRSDHNSARRRGELHFDIRSRKMRLKSCACTTVVIDVARRRENWLALLVI